MNIHLHKRARTTPAIREEIRESSLSERALAKQYNISRATVRKWKNRDSVEDQSNRPHTIHATLTAVEEGIVVELRKTLLLPLDDLLTIVREFIQPTLSRSALDRCLRRYGVSKLNKLLPIEEKESSARKSFKVHAPGFVYVDCKELPKMADESSRKYLFVAIDRASHWVVHEIRTVRSAQGFLKNLLQKAPFVIAVIFTGDGTEFTDQVCVNGQAEPSGTHPVDQFCARHNIEHRLMKTTFAQTNGWEEGSGQKEAVLPDQIRFRSGDQLKETLLSYNRIYNHQIPQKILNQSTPIQALKKWQKSHPMLFNKSVYDQRRLDRYQHTAPAGNVDVAVSVRQPRDMACAKTGQGDASSAQGRLSTEQEELLRLREENRRLRLEREILKKAKGRPGSEWK